MSKRIVTFLLLLLLPGIAASQSGKDQPLSILVHIGPPVQGPATTANDSSITGIISPLMPGESYQVFLLSSAERRVVARTEADSQGQFRFPNLMAQDFDLVVRTEKFEDARLTRVSPGKTLDSRLTLTPRASVVVNLGDSNPFVVDIADITRKYPRKAVDEFQKAVVSNRIGDTARAVGILEALLESTPDYYEAHLLLGTIYQRLGQFRDAEKQYNASSELSPRQALPMVNLATLYLQEAEANETAEEAYFVTGVMYDDALHVLQDAARVEPRNARIFFLLGITFYRTHNDSLAETSLTQALAFDGNMSSARIALANVYIREKKWKEALNQFDEYLADNPNSADRAQIETVRDRVLRQP